MSAGLFREAAAATQVGECRWCGVLVYDDQPRLSHAALVWHLSCAKACRDLLTKILGPVDTDAA